MVPYCSPLIAACLRLPGSKPQGNSAGNPGRLSCTRREIVQTGLSIGLAELYVDDGDLRRADHPCQAGKPAWVAASAGDNSSNLPFATAARAGIRPGSRVWREAWAADAQFEPAVGRATTRTWRTSTSVYGALIDRRNMTGLAGKRSFCFAGAPATGEQCTEGTGPSVWVIVLSEGDAKSRGKL